MAGKDVCSTKLLRLFEKEQMLVLQIVLLAVRLGGKRPRLGFRPLEPNSAPSYELGSVQGTGLAPAEVLGLNFLNYSITYWSHDFQL